MKKTHISIIVLVVLVLVVLIAYFSIPPLIKGTNVNVYNGKYMSFEYPKSWNNTTTFYNQTIGQSESELEYVELEDKYGELQVTVIAYNNATIEDVEKNEKDLQKILNELYPPQRNFTVGSEIIGEVKCIKYEGKYKNVTSSYTYIFEKNGIIFKVECNNISKKFAKQVIETLEAKKPFFTLPFFKFLF